METIQRQVRIWMISQRDQELEETVSAIAGGQVVLVDVVRALQIYLTSEEGHIRTRGATLNSPGAHLLI